MKTSILILALISTALVPSCTKQEVSVTATQTKYVPMWDSWGLQGK